jgi:hypothetical protein
MYSIHSKFILFEHELDGLVWFMVFNATFNNISVISWRSVLLVDETGENHQPVATHWQTLSHNVVVSSTPRQGFHVLFKIKKNMYI